MSKFQIENNSLIGGEKLQMEKTTKCSEFNCGIEMQNGTNLFENSKLADEKDGIEKENQLFNPQNGIEENNGEIENGENNIEIESPSIAKKYANFGFGTAAIHASINPQRWDMHQVKLINYKFILLYLSIYYAN